MKETEAGLGHQWDTVLRHSTECFRNPGRVAGEQLIRIVFDKPVDLRFVRVVFEEKERARTQEFVLRWSNDQGQTHREIVRQQYNFSPPDCTVEEELYSVNLADASELVMQVIPDTSRPDAFATLKEWRLATSQEGTAN